MHQLYRFLCLALLLPALLPAQDATTRVKELLGDLRARQIGPAIMSGRINTIETQLDHALAFLRSLYVPVNETGKPTVTVTCPHCQTDHEVDLAELGGA